MQPTDERPHTLIREMRPEDRDAVVAILTSSDPWKRLGFTAVDWDASFPAPSAGTRLSSKGKAWCSASPSYAENSSSAII